MMRRRVRFAAVLVVVVLALTGFSTSSSGGKGKSGKSSSSGGGCSHSKKSNSGHNDYDDDDYDSSSSGSSGGSAYETATPAATASSAADVRVIRCAQPRRGKRKAVVSSTVELRATATVPHTYDIDVTFLDAQGNTVSTGETTVDAEAGDVKTVTVRMDSPGKVSRVKRCRVTAELRY